MSREFSFTYIHISCRHQTAAGRTWFDCGDLHVNRRGLLGVRHLFDFVCKIKRAAMSDESDARARLKPQYGSYGPDTS